MSIKGLASFLHCHLTDPISFEPFKDPKALPCGHSFSQETINRLQTDNCPTCQRHFDRQNLPNHYALKGLMETASKKTTPLEDRLLKASQALSEDSGLREAFQRQLALMKTLTEQLRQSEKEICPESQALGNRAVQYLEKAEKILRLEKIYSILRESAPFLLLGIPPYLYGSWSLALGICFCPLAATARKLWYLQEV